MMNQPLFSTLSVNKGRQPELDVIKGLAILFMVVVHVVPLMMWPGLTNSPFDQVVTFLGRPAAAPVFMFALGVGLIYSKRTEADYLLRRGLQVLMTGYILNIARGFLPLQIYGRAIHSSEYLNMSWDQLFIVDIMMFAGLTFLFFGLVKRLKIKDYYLPVIVATLFAANYGLTRLFPYTGEGYSTGNRAADYFFALFWGTSEFSAFPFFIWLAYPVAGYFFGQLLIRCQDKQRFYTRLLIIGGPVALALWLYAAEAMQGQYDMGVFPLSPTATYYHESIWGVLTILSGVIVWLGLAYFMARILPRPVMSVLSRWSQNINQMYVASWMLIVVASGIFGREQHGALACLGISLLVLIGSDLISSFLARRRLAGKARAGKNQPWTAG